MILLPAAKSSDQAAWSAGHPARIEQAMTQEDRPDPETTRELNELGQLAAGVGHNVINAFSTVVSNAELLRLLVDQPRAVDRKKLADTIIRAAMDASGVARRLIDYSRAATSLSATARDVDLGEFLAEQVRGLEAAGRAGMSYGLSAERVPRILGCEVQLRDMLGHLVQNAHEAMPPSGGRIEFALSQDDRGWIVLEVKDDGSGMTANVQEHAVEPFFTTKAGRMGVGLTIAHGIWRRHRGTLALRGQEGEGTIVRLSIEPGAPGQSTRAGV